jgi:glycosyltransferase involved in cell wall biosynthesis
MDEPRLTALMPLKHYDPDLLAAAVDSLFQQTSAAWRLSVIVEADERDHFERVLADRLQDVRVQLVTNEGRKLAGAFNTGMRCAGTEFVAILFGDDLWAPNAVAVLNEHIAQAPDVDFFHSGRIIIDEHGKPLSSVHTNPEVIRLEDYLNGGSPVKHLLCWRKTLALTFGGMDEASQSVGPDDYDFPWTMLEHGAKFQTIHQPLYLYRDHRALYRLTTHLPVAVHKAETARIMQKHGASPAQIRAKLKAAERSYLRQCLYGSAWQEWLDRRFGVRLRRVYRERYR